MEYKVRLKIFKSTTLDFIISRILAVYLSLYSKERTDTVSILQVEEIRYLLTCTLLTYTPFKGKCSRF